MPTLIQQWVTPTDPGGGNPQREYSGPLIGAGWTHLSATLSWNKNFPGSFRIEPEENSLLWFNQVWVGPGGATVSDPNQAFVTSASSVAFVTTNSTPSGLVVQVSLFGDLATPATHCPYGTRAQAGAPVTLIVTPALVTGWLATFGMEWAAPLFAGFYFATINISDLCAVPPPAPGPIDLSTLDAGALTLGQYLKAFMWPNLCECIPGTPTPTPFPPPTQTEPPGWPAQPTFSCSNTDICTTLLDVQRQVAALGATLSEVSQLTTFIQRYQLPFAYIRGATHHATAGPGSFAISRLIGMQALASFPADGHPILEGNPPYQMSKSWMAIQDSSGLLGEKRIVRHSQIWLPPDFATATSFSYELEPGVEVDFTELEAEP